MVGSSNAGQEHRLILGFSVHLSGTHQDCCISAKATGIVRKFTMCILHVSKSTVMGQDGGVREVRGTHVCTLFGFASIDLMDVFPFLVGPKKVKWQHDKQPNEQWNMWHWLIWLMSFLFCLDSHTSFSWDIGEAKFHCNSRCMHKRPPKSAWHVMTSSFEDKKWCLLQDHEKRVSCMLTRHAHWPLSYKSVDAPGGGRTRDHGLSLHTFTVI